MASKTEMVIADPFDALTAVSLGNLRIGSLMAVTDQLLEEIVNGDVAQAKVLDQVEHCWNLVQIARDLHSRAKAQFEGAETCLYHRGIPQLLNRGVA